MNPVEEIQEHPDEILHRARVGLPLSPRERQLRLEHLRGCAACRFLEEARGDLLEEAARPAVGGTSITALVAATMASFQPVNASDIRLDRPLARPVPTRRRVFGRASAFAAALVCMVAGAALAAHWIARPRVAVPPAPPMAPTVRARVAAVSPRVGASAPSLSPESPGSFAGLVASEGPATLFARATDARREGRTAEARGAYERLWRDFPGTPEAQTGRVAYGRWLFDRNEAGPAAVAFADYLRDAPHGTLAAEAAVGLAEALEALGDWPRARRAWQNVLANPAAGMHARHARARVRALAAWVRPGGSDWERAP